MNMRSIKVMPITRKRCRGSYTVTAKVTAKAITRDKALELGKAINQAMRDLGLVGIVKLDYNIVRGSDVSKL